MTTTAASLSVEERRFTPNRKPVIQKRSDGKTVITGYASVFYREDDEGTEYDLGYGIIERIANTAFDRALKEKQDVVCRFDHEEPLGRSSSGTLRMKVDNIGLYYECDVPDTQCGRDTATLIERGDIQGSSFAFRATVVEWMDEGESGSVRMIKDCNLYDVGPVVFPAYASTTTGVRSADDANARAVVAERDEWRAKMTTIDQLGKDTEDAIKVALALVNLDD